MRQYKYIYIYIYIYKHFGGFFFQVVGKECYRVAQTRVVRTLLVLHRSRKVYR